MKLVINISLLVFNLLVYVNTFSQSISESYILPVKTQKWQASEVSYLLKDNDQIAASDSTFSLIDGVRKIYKIFISDVDGDNCPFQPTCSSFFVRSVKLTNIFQGTLMAADRLSRDLNIVKNHYPITYEGYFIDPPGNYTLDINNINLLPYNSK